jgi:DNA mismatch endonuclease, patch repair protein
MADIMSPEKRSVVMSRIRSRNTKPEMAVRSALHRMGVRFRLHRKDLPGRPDIVLPRYRTVVFVHGCFWHQHAGCRLASKPSSNTEYWLEKLRRNQERFTEHAAALAESGWRVAVIWECETRHREELNGIILERAGQSSPSTSTR